MRKTIGVADSFFWVRPCGESQFLVNCVISYVIYNINGDGFFYTNWKTSIRDTIAKIRGAVYGGCGEGFRDVWRIH